MTTRRDLLRLSALAAAAGCSLNLSRLALSQGQPQGHGQAHRDGLDGLGGLIYGVQMGGPYLPPGYMRLRVQFPGNHGGVNWYHAWLSQGAGLVS